MLIGFVRHGQTDWNVEGRIQGQTDIPLNNEGISQAHALAARLQSEDKIWDAVLSSDLIRARHSAEIIAGSLGIPLLDGDSRLRERSFGEAEGLLRSEREQRWGENWMDCVQGYETDELLQNRGIQVIEELQNKSEPTNVLIVSHGAFLAQMLGMLCPKLQDERILNLSYTIIKREEAGWQPLLHNCTLHLSSSLSRE